MTTEMKPITEQDLEVIEGVMKDVAAPYADCIRHLVSEVRRLLEEAVGAQLIQLAYNKAIDRWEETANAYFSANVEIENLRKMLADANAREANLITLLDQIRKTYPNLRVDLDLDVDAVGKPDALRDLFPPARGEGRSA